MTAQELINVLKKFPPQTLVLIGDRDFGFADKYKVYKDQIYWKVNLQPWGEPHQINPHGGILFDENPPTIKEIDKSKKKKVIIIEKC